MKVQFSTINSYSKNESRFDSNRQNRTTSCSFGIEPPIPPKTTKELAEELNVKLIKSMNKAVKNITECVKKIIIQEEKNSSSGLGQ